MDGTMERRQTLIEILRRTAIPDRKEQMIQEISRLADVSDNFIISLLKNKFGDIIPFIYKSPYVLSKLTDAGFETDPRTKDSEGKSAFFHAFKSEESHLVMILYDYSSNACLLADASVRSPNQEIVDNLLRLKDYLEKLGKDLKSEEISEKSRWLFRDLCRFNDLQIEMCKNVSNISSKKNCNYTDKENEPLKRKETMLAILKTYKSYFDYDNGDSAKSLKMDSNLLRFENFFKHVDYYDKLDFSSAIMFFDNLFLLKERWNLPNNEYLEVESIFFLFIFCRKNLEQYEKQPFYFFSRWVAFQERLLLQKQLCSFQDILEKTEDNIINRISKSTVTTLTNLPEIYGQFIIFRLQNYSNTVTDLTVKDLKSILVIERCLEVLGECCKQSDFNSVQRILILALPKDFIKYLKQIRNRLAHIKPQELLYRNNLEEDVELFKGIQNELNKLKQLMLPIYSAHAYEMGKFLRLRSLKSIQKADSSIWVQNLFEGLLPSPEIEKNQFLKPRYECQSQRKRYFGNMHAFLREQNDTNCKGIILDKNTISCYKHIIQNMISAIGEVLKNLTSSIPEKTVGELDSHFWCLENILSYISQDRKLTKYHRALMPILKERKSLFIELSKNRNLNTSTNSIIVGTPVVEGKLVGNCSPTEPEDTLDNSQQTANPVVLFEKYASFIVLDRSSSTFSNENENNGFSHENHDSSETNHEENETNGGNFENGVSENVCHGSMIQKTIDTKECKEIVDHHENTKDLDDTTSRDDWSLSNVYCNYPINDEAEDPAEIMDAKIKTFIKDTRTFLDEYKKFADTLFQKFPCDLNEEFHFKNIKQYCLILKGHNFLNEEEKESILQSVPNQFQNTPGLKKKIKALLNEENNFTAEIEDELLNLNLKKQEIKNIKFYTEKKSNDKSYQIIDDARDYFLELKETMELNEMKRGEYELLCEKLKIPDDAKNKLLKIVSGQNKKVSGNLFEFLRKRIELLKNVLIDEYDSIRQLWQRATTPRRKMYVKEKIVQLYLNDCEIQAAVETLLFDCMVVLNNYKLNNLWKKTTNLLNGINLRNVLAHGHPLLESLGRLLDPSDLPSELVDKMLKLISDENVIYCILQVLERSETHRRSFMEILQDEQFKVFREQILECDHFYEYVPSWAPR